MEIIISTFKGIHYLIYIFFWAKLTKMIFQSDKRRSRKSRKQTQEKMPFKSAWKVVIHRVILKSTRSSKKTEYLDRLSPQSQSGLKWTHGEVAVFGSTVYKIFALKCQKLHTPLASLAPCVIKETHIFPTVVSRPSCLQISLHWCPAITLYIPATPQSVAPNDSSTEWTAGSVRIYCVTPFTFFFTPIQKY